MPYGDNYLRWFTDDGTPVPFPNPANESQRVANARARAAAHGQPIDSGYLNPTSGTLENPNDEPWYLDPRIMGPLALGAVSGVGALGALGGGGAATTMIPGTGIPTVAGTGVGVTAPAAAAAGTVAATTAAGTSAIQKLRNSLTSSQGIGALASLLPALAMAGGGGGGNGSGSEELRRIQGITEARMRRADPLHQAAVQLAFQRAPIKAREGISLTNVPLPE